MRHLSFWFCTFAAVILPTLPCHAALQPLDIFLVAAKENNHDLLGAQAISGQKRAEAQAARNKLMPGLDVGGTYTRNAFKAEFPAGPGGKSLTIVPFNQLDASATLSVPIIDIANWARYRAGNAQADAAHANLLQTSLTVSAQVMMRYFALLGQEGLYQAAHRRLDVASVNAQNVQARNEVGSSSSLDVARAQSDVAQAQQDVAAALLQVQLSRRALQTLTNIEPDEGGALDEVPLHQEADLQTWLCRVGPALPPIYQADAQQRAARAAEHAARFGYMPTLMARGTERFTNASGLNGGHPFVWQATLNLAWHFDLTMPATEQALKLNLIAAQQASLGAARAAQDRIFQDFAQIEANLAKSAAARSQVAATRLGAQWANEKYAAGMLTQLEVSQAQRDAFLAEASRIQADTDLLYYRAMLRLDAGFPPEALKDSP